VFTTSRQIGQTSAGAGGARPTQPDGLCHRQGLKPTRFHMVGWVSRPILRCRPCQNAQQVSECPLYSAVKSSSGHGSKLQSLSVLQASRRARASFFLFLFWAAAKEVGDPPRTLRLSAGWRVQRSLKRSGFAPDHPLLDCPSMALATKSGIKCDPCVRG
jgi:hypothetical protein